MDKMKQIEQKERIKQECLAYVKQIMTEYGVSEDSKFYIEAKRHAENLYDVNLQVLIQLVEVPEEYYQKFFQLFFSSYLIDSALDLERENAWNKPVYLFAGMKMVSEYFSWLKEKCSQDMVAVYEKYYQKQLEYQVLERKWEMPIAYIQRFHSYEMYHQKQLILLYPLLLLSQYGIEENRVTAIYQAFQLYYSIALAVDDYYDAKFDIENQTLTPISAKYYLINGELPSVDSDLKEVLIETEKEICSLIKQLQAVCKENDLDENAFLKTIKLFVDVENGKIK